MDRYLKALTAVATAAYNRMVSLLVGVSCLLIMLMMLSIGASVLLRRTPLDFGWALEVSEYILIFITLSGAGWLMRSGGHIRVDILATYLRGKSKDLYNCLIFIIVSIICLSFTWIGFQATREAYLTGTLEIKVYLLFEKWILLSLFPFAGFIMFIESLKLAWGHFKSLRKRTSSRSISRNAGDHSA
jgi:TRAP-type C4-dicarboxylate transport system permease small subunit